MFNGNQIKVNYTAYLVNNWEAVVQKHIDALKDSGLYSVIDQFNIFVYPKNERLQQILCQSDIDANVYYQDNNKYEYPALQDIIYNPLEYNLYFHTKGVTRTEKTYLQNSIIWNDYMTYFNIYKYRDCIEELSKYDCVGVEFATSPFPHYSGNFWWATMEHLRKLQNSIYLKNINYRLNAEKIIGSINGKYLSMCNTGEYGGLYFKPFPKEKWIRKDSEFNL